MFDDYEIVQICAGDLHCAAIDRFGRCYTWGSFTNGKLGLGKIAHNVLKPKLVELLLGFEIIQVYCCIISIYILCFCSIGRSRYWSLLGLD